MSRAASGENIQKRLLRLIGRDQELRQLLALWKRAKAGEGQVALICGEAGIGKSHLCEILPTVSSQKVVRNLPIPMQ